MNIKEVKTIFGKKKYYLYENGKKCVNVAFDALEYMPNSDLIKVERNGKCNVFDSSITKLDKNQILTKLEYNECYDHGSFVLLKKRFSGLKFVDKKTHNEIDVPDGEICLNCSKFIIYCGHVGNLNYQYAAILDTNKGMETDSEISKLSYDEISPYDINFYLFNFSSRYWKTGHYISYLKNPREVYKIVRNFLKRLLNEDIINYDKDTEKYRVPDSDFDGRHVRSMIYSTPEEAKQQANKFLKHIDNIVLPAIENVEKAKEEEQAFKQQHAQEVQSALDDFNAEDSNVTAQ